MGWKIILMLSVLQIISAEKNKQMVLHGYVKFEDKMPATIPKGSCLVVKLEDTRLVDAPSITIASRVYENSDLKLTDGGIPYNLTFPSTQESEYTVSATLNVGWCANGGSSWLHHGDYLTTSSFGVKVSAKKNVYAADVTVEYYGNPPANVHHHKRDDDPCIHAPCMNSICRSFANGSYVCIKVAGMPCALPSCSAIYEPICASNGKTYDNECIMLSDSCPNGVKISLSRIHDGECYSKHSMLGGILFATCIALLSVLGFVTVFWIWRRNRKLKMELMMGTGSIKKVSPLGI